MWKFDKGLVCSLVGLLVLGACGGGDDDDAPSGSGGSGGAVSATGGSGGAPSITPGTGGAAAGNAGSGGAVSSGSGGVGSGGTGTGGTGTGGSAAGDAGLGDGGLAGTRVPATSLSLPTMMESPMVEPWFNVYRPMDLDATGELLPVIVWANGGCYRSDFTWAPLFERWASGGFVVLALTEGPDGPLVTSSVEDQGGLIDWALAQAASGPYAGKLDVERIIAAGNSCGGVTALGLAADDDRVKSVFVLSGSSAFAGADTAVIGGISVPVGYVVGGKDEDIAHPNATADYEALADGIPAMIISRSSGDHMTVSTDEMVLPQVAEMALNWMDLTLYGTKEAADALNSATLCTGCASGDWSMISKSMEKLTQ